MKFKFKISYLYTLLFILSLTVVTYLSRWIFFYKFDPVYWENAYYESQWNVPNSPRGIGDEGVYRYIGYRLVNNHENPFNVDYWVPPLGKYTYGLTAKYFHNPYLASYLYYLASILIFYQISKIIFSNLHQRWISIFLFAFNPAIVDQITTTMLDLPLTFFFILFLFFFFRYLKSSQTTTLFLSALSLGLMAAVKPPYFIPMFALMAVILLLKRKQYKYIIPFGLLVAAGYALAYFPTYFIYHPNPIPWLRLHQKVIDFQKGNGGSADWFNILRFIFTRKYIGYWVGHPTLWPTNWSLLLPLGLIASIISLFQILTKKIKNDYLLFSSLVVIGYIFMNFTIDFWPRYLIPLIPLLIISLVLALNRLYLLNTLIILIYLPFLYLNFFPSSQSTLDYFRSRYQSQFYKDTYQMLDTQTLSNINQESWQQISNQTQYSDETFVPIKEHGQWKIKLTN